MPLLTVKPPQHVAIWGACSYKHTADIQGVALQAMKDALRPLADIAQGIPHEVEFTKDNGTKAKRTIIPYPRDMVAAMKLLHDIARLGILPDSMAVVDRGAEMPALLPTFTRVNPNFTRVEAELPDGTIMVATVNKRDVINAEMEGEG